jgi:hypothetical protein
MANYGDSAVPRSAFVCGTVIKTSMATAIFRTYTASGFVVAADGRKKERDGPVVSEHTQKIFDFGGLAYSFTGNIEMGPDFGPNILFDFTKEFSRFALAISTRRYASLEAYADQISKRVNSQLREALHAGDISLPDRPSRDQREPGYDIATVLIDGFFNREPSSVKVRFYHEKGMVQDPIIRIQDLVVMRRWTCGLPEVWDMLVNNSPQFSKYIARLPVAPHEDEVLSNEITSANCYIKACAGPEAKVIDEDIASGIGRNVHVATVTLRQGFRWVEGFHPGDEN